MLSLYPLRVVSLRVFKRGKEICKEKCRSRILLRRQSQPRMVLRMKAVHLPTSVEIPNFSRGYLPYNGLRGLPEFGNYLLRIRPTC